MPFKLVSDYKPAGDQPTAIKSLVSGIKKGHDRQTLLGVTGSGKTFTMANVIEQVQMPTLVIAHNKTLAAQLCNEFREFFPDSAVEYFVSYYDYYQPEAYISSSDTYIEKEAQVNDEIDRLRHACTQALLTREDVIIVASVSTIYGLGSPKEYEKIVLQLEVGQKLDRRGVMEQLINMQFERTNADLYRGSFRMRGQVFEIMPVNEEMIYRLEVADHIVRIEQVEAISRKVRREQEDLWLFPAKHYVVGDKARTRAIGSIEAELKERLDFFKKQGKVLEYERLKRRVAHDLELIKQVGYCNGIENYSRLFEGRKEGEPPFTLLDYFTHSRGGYDATQPHPNPPLTKGRELAKRGFLTIIDESHVTVPQIRAMYKGDRSRKDNLVEHGFRLPSARDNRPLQFEEFDTRVGQTVYVSATPNEYEKEVSDNIAEQIVRPTGLVDPEVEIRPVTGGLSKDTNNKKQTNSKFQNTKSQVDDVIEEIQKQVKKGDRTLVTTLTKRMAEDLTEYLQEKGIKVKYLHSDILTIERIEIITSLRKGEVDVIVGVNLLREGLDIPEVSLVAILDADKEGFLRSETSLVQTIGRAARNADGRVILYADNITGSIERAIKETDRRRNLQLAYNKKHGITPKTIEKSIKNILEEFGLSATKDSAGKKARKQRIREIARLDTLGDGRSIADIIKDKQIRMKEAAKNLEFEVAAILRDEIRELSAREKTEVKKRGK